MAERYLVKLNAVVGFPGGAYTDGHAMEVRGAKSPEDAVERTRVSLVSGLDRGERLDSAIPWVWVLDADGKPQDEGRAFPLAS